MKKALVLLTLAALASCYKPGSYPIAPKMQAFDHMESFRGYFLQGRTCDAAVAFEQGLTLMKRIDDMCGISDAYVQRYLFYTYAGLEKPDHLARAKDFGEIGHCAAELGRIRQIETKAAPSDPGAAPNDIYRSVMLRRAAVASKDAKKVEEALSIDRPKGWTLFTLLDLNILKDLTADEAGKALLQKRIDLLTGQIQKCE